MDSQAEDNARPWYREFWFWFVFGPLIFIIIMCCFTVSIALRGADDVIIDNYYKEGQMINQALDQDRRAAELGLSATLQFDITTGEIILTLPQAPTGAGVIPEQLLLLMAHPVKAAKDQQILLTHIGAGRYRGELATEPKFSWYLSLYPTTDIKQRNKAEWTLSGQINFSESQRVELAPRVE